jgi:hypothetical protein
MLRIADRHLLSGECRCGDLIDRELRVTVVAHPIKLVIKKHILTLAHKAGFSTDSLQPGFFCQYSAPTIMPPWDLTPSKAEANRDHVEKATETSSAGALQNEGLNPTLLLGVRLDFT